MGKAIEVNIFELMSQTPQAKNLRNQVKDDWVTIGSAAESMENQRRGVFTGELLRACQTLISRAMIYNVYKTPAGN